MGFDSQTAEETGLVVLGGLVKSSGTQKDISMSILQGCSYIIGLHYKGGIWDIPILSSAYVLFWGPENPFFVKAPRCSGGRRGAR